MEKLTLLCQLNPKLIAFEADWKQFSAWVACGYARPTSIVLQHNSFHYDVNDPGNNLDSRKTTLVNKITRNFGNLRSFWKGSVYSCKHLTSNLVHYILPLVSNLEKPAQKYWIDGR